MRKTVIIATFLSSVFLISCKNISSEQSIEKGNEFPEEELELSQHYQNQKKLTSVQDDPVKMMQLIFEVAKTNDFNRLEGLCDPTGSGDRDTKLICSVGSQSLEIQKEFKEYFQNGRVIGTAIIIGNSAIVKFKFGPDGNRDEQMNFVQIGEKWYLSSY